MDYEFCSFTSESWLRRWDTNQTGWHINFVHRSLIAFWNELCPSDTPANRLFIPLCGKSVDMEWLYQNKSCQIIGCDIAENPLRQFVNDHKSLNMKERLVYFKNGENVLMFHTDDNRLRLYCCSLFSMDSAPEEPFNLIWDRGSFVAIHPSLRSNYVTLITNITTKDVRWLQETLNYPPGVHNTAPCSSTDEEMKLLYNKDYNMKLLRYEDIKFHLFPNAEYCYVRLMLFTKRQSHQ
uniref:thiopurine S-methyltransferase n=1 Tax=Schistosoma japonicum TaxID=6182 RepID=Q5DFY1_SCHJA|nr:SJCHGC01817 protein [Schistosoma japonicum]